MSQDAIYSNGTYLSNNPTWHEEDSPWKARQIARMLGRNGIVPSSVCEIGCGAGGILAALASEYGDGVQFSGYEISPQAFDLCDKKRRPNLQFFLKDLFDEPAPVFEVALAIDVFEHVEDYFGFLRKFKGCGAYKLFHIPLDLSVQSLLRSSILLNSRASVGHIHYFTKETALATLKDAGYEVIDHFYTAPSLELPDLPWETRLMHLPRRLLFALHQDWAARILGGFSLLVLAK